MKYVAPIYRQFTLYVVWFSFLFKISFFFIKAVSKKHDLISERPESQTTKTNDESTESTNPKDERSETRPPTESSQATKEAYISSTTTRNQAGKIDSTDSLSSKPRSQADDLTRTAYSVETAGPTVKTVTHQLNQRGNEQSHRKGIAFLLYV